MSCPAHEIAAVKGGLSSKQVDTLISIAENLPDHLVRVYDLGCGVGTAALAVMQGRQNAIEVVSVDNRETEIYWVGVAMKNIGREKDWKGIAGNVLDPNIVPEDNSIDFLIVDVDEISYDDVIAVWREALTSEGFTWTRHLGEEFGDPEDAKVEISTEDEPRSSSPDTFDAIGGRAEPPTEEDRPPCDFVEDGEVCGYAPPEEKSYPHAMRAHQRTHRDD